VKASGPITGLFASDYHGCIRNGKLSSGERAMPEPERMHLPDSYGAFEPFTFESAPDWDDIERALEISRNYWIAMCDAHGPHTVPVWGVWLDGTFLFSTDPGSRKGRALAGGGQCSVHLESADEVIILHGWAEPLPDELREPFIESYFRKYGVLIDPLDPAQAIFRIIPAVAFSWIERDYLHTAARWKF
jgi:hypothetical protein